MPNQGHLPFLLAFQEGSGRFLCRHERRSSNLRTDVDVFVATKEEKYIFLSNEAQR